MKLKSAVIGLLVSAAVAAPVVQAVNLSLKPVGNSVVAYRRGLPPNGEVFANWTQQFRQWTLSFGVNNSTKTEAVGLRISAPSSVKAENWSMDVNTTNGNSPFFETWAIEPGNNLPRLASVVNAFSPGTNYTVTAAGHGFQRVRFNALTGLPAGSSFSSIYFADQTTGTGSNFNDIVKNGFVNGVPVTPNIQPNPQFDCALFFF